jgi:hypothetical protein
MLELKIPEKMSLNWARYVVNDRAQRDDEQYEINLINFYESLINYRGYTATKKNGKTVCVSNGISYGDRTLQRRRAYEVMELIRDRLFNREVQNEYSPFSR